MLLNFILLPLLGVFINFILPLNFLRSIKLFSLIWSNFIFLITISLFCFFDSSNPYFQFFQTLYWFWFPSNIVSIGLDGFSLILILLTSFLIVICNLLCWNFYSEQHLKIFNITLFSLQFCLFVAFSSLDLILFYISFEAVLIPMYLLIGIFGSRSRRIRASYILFFYTLFSSIFMLLAIIYIFLLAGNSDYQYLKTLKLSSFTEKICWLAFFFSFAVKTPLVPFHIWLPEAHCEAPTAGSVILAGILLKLGGFGFYRYSIGLFPESCAFYSPFVFSFCVFSIIYASITTLQQIDLKKIIAYSSIGHMGLVTIGLFSNNTQGVLGSAFLMFSHGIVSSALFLCVGILYERHHTRIIKYYTGLIYTMPLFCIYFTLFTLSNIGLPGTSNFIGEFLIIVGCFEINQLASLLTGITVILSAGYGLWLYNRLLFGNLKQFFLPTFKDLTRFEYYILFPFAILCTVLGFFPNIILIYITFV